MITNPLYIDTSKLTPEELETVKYLQECMDDTNEKGMLARVVYNLMALGKATPLEVAETLGAYNQDGIVRDSDDNSLDMDDENENIGLAPRRGMEPDDE